MSHWLVGTLLGVVSAGLVLTGVFLVDTMHMNMTTYDTDVAAAQKSVNATTSAQTTTPPPTPSWPLPLDTVAYDKRMLALAHYTPPATTSTTTLQRMKVGTTTVTKKITTLIAPVSPLVVIRGSNVTIKSKRWPTEQPYPAGGALLPFHRIVAYYGNFYSAPMGILGELDEPDVIAHLDNAVAQWNAADPTTPVLPAIDYIAMVAQGSSGADGMYRAVMPDSEIDKAYAMAQTVHGILILDLQVGLSTIQKELPQFKKYLSRPDVELAIDPEFSMKTGAKPGTVIGTYDAADINFVINWLANIVKEYKLPPKVLIVHRFTEAMVTNYQNITPTPEVQVVMNMDGWGSQQLKKGTYNNVIEPEPVQFTGFKIFYQNDIKPPSTGLYTPAQVLQLYPAPIYIQYQ